MLRNSLCAVQKNNSRKKNNYHYLFLIKQKKKEQKKELMCMFEAVTLLSIKQNDFPFTVKSCDV
jgi:hypothetical protein